MRFVTLVALVALLLLPCSAQQELGSTSATSSIPTGSDRNAEIRAENNPIVKAYGDKIRKLGIGSVDFLNQLDVYQRAYSRAPNPSTGAFSSLEIKAVVPTGPTPPSTPEPTILKAAQELLIADLVSKQQNIKLNQLMKARSLSPGLYEAVAALMEAKRSGNQAVQVGKGQAVKMDLIPPDAKDAALESIMTACNNLGFTCRQPNK